MRIDSNCVQRSEQSDDEQAEENNRPVSFHYIAYIALATDNIMVMRHIGLCVQMCTYISDPLSASESKLHSRVDACFDTSDILIFAENYDITMVNIYYPFIRIVR